MEQKRQGGLRQEAWMNYLLIAFNVLVFAAGMAGRDGEYLYRAGVLYAPLLLQGQGFYRLVTSIFLHADVSHLFNNMIVQFAGGEVAEKNLGHIRYGILYILCGIGGNLVSVASDFHTGKFSYSIGASGAVFGVTGALLFMILREAKNMRSAAQRPDHSAYDDDRRDAGGRSDRALRGPQGIESRAGKEGRISAARMKSLLIRAGLMTAFLLYSGWSNPAVNQAAHIGGLVCGFVLAAVLMPRGGSDLSDLL